MVGWQRLRVTREMSPARMAWLIYIAVVRWWKSLTEAAQIQVDFVRDSAAANYDEVRGAYDVARETVMDGAEAARTRAADMWPFAKKAA